MPLEGGIFLTCKVEFGGGRDRALWYREQMQNGFEGQGVVV